MKLPWKITGYAKWMQSIETEEIKKGAGRVAGAYVVSREADTPTHCHKALSHSRSLLLSLSLSPCTRFFRNQAKAILNIVITVRE